MRWAAGEFGRVILNFHVDDAQAAAGHLDGLDDVTWLSELELRGDAWFAALLDPDGNCSASVSRSVSDVLGAGPAVPRLRG